MIEQFQKDAKPWLAKLKETGDAAILANEPAAFWEHPPAALR